MKKRSTIIKNYKPFKYKPPFHVYVNTLWQREYPWGAKYHKFHFDPKCAIASVNVAGRGSGLSKQRQKCIRYIWIAKAFTEGLFPCKKCCGNMSIDEIASKFNAADKHMYQLIKKHGKWIYVLKCKRMRELSDIWVENYMDVYTETVSEVG